MRTPLSESSQRAMRATVSDPIETILQVNTRDQRGGAERVALNLHRAFRARGLDAHLAVGDRRTDEAGVAELSMAAGRSALYGAWRLAADMVGGVARAADVMRGVEPFHYPATYRLPALVPRVPDVIHAHNLHGGYFDLRALPWLSRRAPLALTLHDAWLLSGHCAHSFDCERWRSGCGECPDLSIYPAVRRDRTGFNWRRKRDVYRRSRLFVSTPCEWLMERVGQSILNEAIVDRRVIPNGVDLTVFKPGARAEARASLGFDPQARVVLFVASGGPSNPFKDYATVRAAVERIASAIDAGTLTFVALGGGPSEPVPGAELRSVPFHDDVATVARYYQAADLYLHAARADTFPNTIIESLACGTPVVATAVGGIPEQIRSLAGAIASRSDSRPTAESTRGSSPEPPWREYGAHEATGVLHGAGDAAALAHSALRLFQDPDLRAQMGANATRDAARRFDLERQVDAVLDWYDAIVRSWRPE